MFVVLPSAQYTAQLAASGRFNHGLEKVISSCSGKGHLLMYWKRVTAFCRPNAGFAALLCNPLTDSFRYCPSQKKHKQNVEISNRMAPLTSTGPPV